MEVPLTAARKAPDPESRWRARYRNGSVAIVKASDYAAALRGAAQYSTEPVRDLVLQTDEAADRARAVRAYLAVKA